MSDRVGIGWRPELAAGIWANLDRIDLVEVIADDLYRAPRPRVDAIRTLAAQVPVTLHGVGMGLCSTSPVEQHRLDGMARLVEAIRPESWSEHLAFVRGGGHEIGHLAMPPRCPQTLEGLARNVERARQTTGLQPLLENVATLLDPPGSTLDEAAFLLGAIEATGSELLLDLHNLHTNAFNLGYDATAALRALPPERIGALHLAGGRLLTGGARPKLLDDHLHDVPEEVYALLADLAERTERPLTVVLERDGRYPSMDHLLHELERAREAIATGRSRKRTAA